MRTLIDWEPNESPYYAEAAALQDQPEVTALRHGVKAMVAAYFSSWGIQDPDVLAVITRRMLERAESKLALLGPEAYTAQLRLAAIECCDAYIEAWITNFEKQIDCHGGNSRCAELALRLPVLLKRFPEVILSLEGGSDVARQVIALTSPAQPPNHPTKFAAQPLLGDRSAIRTGLMNWVVSLFRRERAIDL